jgi:hypothetical protein
MALARRGDVDRAVLAAGTLSVGYRRVNALNGIIRVLVEAGDLNRAEEVTRMAEASGERSTLLAVAVGRAVDVGYDLERVEALARTITDPEELSEALARVAFGRGQCGRASELAERAEAVARSATDLEVLSRHFADVARAMGDAVGASELLDRAEAAIRHSTDSGEHTRALGAWRPPRPRVATWTGPTGWPRVPRLQRGRLRTHPVGVWR